MADMTLANLAALALSALHNCRKRDVESDRLCGDSPPASLWESIWESRLETELANLLPSGSGFDCGTKLDIEASKPNRLVFITSFHHMDEHGGYDGWTEHKIIVTPSLVYGFELRVTGKDRNDIKDYIAEVMHGALSVKASWDTFKS